jgi:hypothetical protein
MAWTITSVGKCSTVGGNRGNVYLRATETLTVASSDSAGQDLTSSVIDFLPPGKDFVVISNTGATNLSSDADIAIHCCGTSDGTFVLLKDDLESTIDAAVKSSLYDLSANGEAPYYKVVVDSDGVQKKTDTVVIDIVAFNGDRD